ncbi:MAG: SDR family NAD(P)-dependent oxidoreductase [Bacteroidaceae bacterium]|nr:SDR family NAD(P)-dependent oxidoreductase [Bacteroidaceae bacterium]
MSSIKNKNVLITGGASGIGKLMGEIALGKGAKKLVIWDINQENIDATIAEFKTIGHAIGFRVDVSDYDMVTDAYSKVKQQIGEIDILINCAGIIMSNKTFDQCSQAEMEKTIKVNTLAPMYVAHQVLHEMIERDNGHICNIASAGGMLSNPRMSIYAASKWAAVGWSDSVRIELQEKKSNVRITTIAPYYITTGMFDGVESKVFPLLKPHKVAKGIIKAIEKNNDFKMFMPFIPVPHHFIRLMQGILPLRVFDWLLGEILGIYHTMDNFTGRKK